MNDGELWPSPNDGPKFPLGKTALNSNAGFFSSINFQHAFSDSSLLAAYTANDLSGVYGGGVHAISLALSFHESTVTSKGVLGIVGAAAAEEEV